MFFKKKGMALGKRTWRQKKRAWGGTMLKQAGGNLHNKGFTTYAKTKFISILNVIFL